MNEISTIVDDYCFFILKSTMTVSLKKKLCPGLVQWNPNNQQFVGGLTMEQSFHLHEGNLKTQIKYVSFYETN